MNFISDNQEIFELFELYVQVNIHKIKIEKKSKNSNHQEEYDISKLKRSSIHSFQGVEEECSSITILPQKIVPGSIAEKQLELLLKKTHERKKEFNDFEYKISLIFSKEKIYEFDKQYVQKMPTINKQLEWVCQPKKNQVKILIQHAEQENQIQHLYDCQDQQDNDHLNIQDRKQESLDSIYEIYELKGLNDDIVVVDQISPNKNDRSKGLQASYHSKQDHSSIRGRSVTGSLLQSDNVKHQNDLSFFPQHSVKEEVHEENKEDKDNNVEEYQHIGENQDENRSVCKTKSRLFKVRTKIRQYFSLIKAYILTYRIVENKYINNNFTLRAALLLLIGTKLVKSNQKISLNQSYR